MSRIQDSLLRFWNRCESWMHDIMMMHLVWCISVLFTYRGRETSRRGLVFIGRGGRAWSRVWWKVGRMWVHGGMAQGWISGVLQNNVIPLCYVHNNTSIMHGLFGASLS